MTCQWCDWELPKPKRFKESRWVPNHENKDLILAVFSKISMKKHACKYVVWSLLCL